MHHKSIFANFFYKLLLNILNIVAPVIILPFVYRRLGPESVGFYFYIESIFIYFFLIGSFAIPNYGFRELSKVRDEKAKVDKLFSELFSLGLLSNILALTMYLMFSFLFFENQSYRILSFIFALKLISNIFSNDWVYESFENFKFISLKSMVIRVSSIVLMLLLIKGSQDYIIYAIIIVSYFIINNFLGFIFLKNKVSLRFNNLNIVMHLKFLGIILLMNNSYLLYTGLDKVLIGYYNGYESVAFYVLGEKVIKMVYSLIITLTYVSIPRLSYYVEKNKNQYNYLLNKIYKIFILILFPASIGMFSLSEEIVLLIGGSEYLVASVTMKLFSIYFLFFGIKGFLSSQILFLNRKENIILKYFFICGFLNLVFKLIFRNCLNQNTAILTTIISEFVLLVLIYLFIKKKMKIEFRIFNKNVFNYFLISLLFLPITNFIRLFILNYLIILLVSIILCSSIYFFLLFMVKDDNFIELIDLINAKFINIVNKLKHSD